jgi:hypothetical protein
MFLTDLTFNFNTAYLEGPNFVIDRGMIATNCARAAASHRPPRRTTAHHVAPPATPHRPPPPCAAAPAPPHPTLARRR